MDYEYSIESVMNTFKQMGFESMLSEKYWPKFKDSFNCLNKENKK